MLDSRHGPVAAKGRCVMLNESLSIYLQLVADNSASATSNILRFSRSRELSSQCMACARTAMASGLILALMGCSVASAGRSSLTPAQVSKVAQSDEGSQKALSVPVAKILGLLGQPESKMIALLGKASGKYPYLHTYKVAGFKQVDIAIAELGPMEGHVSFVEFTFESAPKDWKGALTNVGLSSKGVVQYPGQVDGYFKRVKGIPKGFMGLYDSKHTLRFVHWTSGPSDLFEWGKAG